MKKKELSKSVSISKSINKNRQVLTLFILIYPVLLMGICALLGVHWILQILLFFYEAILIKNFTDDYYAVGEE